MDSEPHDVEKQASAIAHEFFWCVAGRHQACVEQLQNASGAVPDAVWWSLCFEPLVFGLSFFGECVRKHYTAPEQELFADELETATRWLLATTLFAPNDVGSAQSQMPPSARIGNPPQRRWVLSQGHERALAPFSRWCEARQGQLQEHTNLQTDSDRLFEDLKTDTTRDGFRCPDTVLRVFAEGVVCDAYRIRSEVLSDLSAQQRMETRLPHARTG
jgi:hypothetical protein